MNVTLDFENFSSSSRKDVSKLIERLEQLAKSTGNDDLNINVKISYVPTKES